MNVAEVIAKLQEVQDKSKECLFADFIPIRMVIEDDDEVFFRDAEGCPPLKKEQVIDIDEQMHEQQERDAEMFISQAENYDYEVPF